MANRKYFQHEKIFLSQRSCPDPLAFGSSPTRGAFRAIRGGRPAPPRGPAPTLGSFLSQLGSFTLPERKIEGTPAAPPPLRRRDRHRRRGHRARDLRGPQRAVDHAVDRHRSPGAPCKGGRRGRRPDSDPGLRRPAGDPPRRRGRRGAGGRPHAGSPVGHLAGHGGRTYRQVLRPEYNFSPPGATFERGDRALTAEGATHRRLHTRPDKGGRPGRASLPTSALRRGAGRRDIVRSEPPPELDQPTPFRLDVAPHQAE
jgi:hypothetical protein